MSVLKYIRNNLCLCNISLHPSLADFFVENLRDNIFISTNNVINKKLTNLECSSDDFLECHNINKEKEHGMDKRNDTNININTNINTDTYTYNNNNDDIDIRKGNTNKLYLKENDKKYDIEQTKKKKKKNEQDIYKKDMQQKNKTKQNDNIFYKLFSSFINIIFPIFKRKEKNEITTIQNKWYSSYIIDYKKTNILYTPDNSSNNYYVEKKKNKIKGLHLTEHIGNINDTSVLTPLSLAIEELKFSNIFKHVWEGTYTNIVFLENTGSSSNHDNEKIKQFNNININNNDSIKGMKVLREDPQDLLKRGANNMKDNNGQMKKQNIIQTQHTNFEMNKGDMNRIDENKGNMNRMDENKYNHYNKYDYPGTTDSSQNHHIHQEIASNILESLNIKEENNFEDVFKNNKNVNVGICTRDTLREMTKPFFLFFRIFNRILVEKSKKLDFILNISEYTYACVFLKSIENSEVSISLRNNKYMKCSYNKNYIKVTDDKIYKEWNENNKIYRRRRNNNMMKMFMFSTNILNRVTTYKDYSYYKNIYKLHVNYNGVCNHIIFTYKYNKSKFLDFIFNTNICYSNSYKNDDIHFNNPNYNLKENIIFSGIWVYGISKRNDLYHNFLNKKKKEKKKKKKDANYNKKNDMYVKGKLSPYDNSSSSSSSSSSSNILNDDNKEKKKDEDIDKTYKKYWRSSSSMPNNFYYDKNNKDLSENIKDEKGKIFWKEQILNYRISSLHRYKRMNILNFKSRISEEKRAYSYLINKTINNSDDILLLSKKGIIKFKNPIVLNELLIGFSFNPIYDYMCKKNNKSIITSDMNILNNMRNKKDDTFSFDDYMNKISCGYNKPQYFYIFFHFYLNNTKKYNIVLEIHVDYFNKFKEYKDISFQYVNVLNYLRGNIHYYRINKIHIEYSLSPFIHKNEYFDHTIMPFYITLNSLIVNESRKVYNYVPIFYTSKINFLQVISRNIKNEKIVDNMNTYKHGEHVNSQNNKSDEKKNGSDESQIKMNNRSKDHDNNAYYEKKKKSMNNNNNTFGNNNVNNSSSGEGPTTTTNEQVERKNNITDGTTEKQFYSNVLNKVIKYFLSKEDEEKERKKKDLELKKKEDYSYFIWKEKNKRKNKNNNSSYINIHSFSFLKYTNIIYHDDVLIKPIVNASNKKKSIIKEEIKELTNIEKDYLQFLKNNLSKYIRDNKNYIIAYNMTNLYKFEYIKNMYIIPPYNKGILINIEKEHEQIYLDIYNNLSYLKYEEINEKLYYNTKKELDIIYLYAAFLPLESDLFHLNYLSQNNLTLNKIYKQHYKIIFKNVIPFTKYDDFYNTHKINPQELIDINSLNLKSNSFPTDLMNLNIDENIYKTKILEFIQNKLKTALQMNSEDKKK
ncbi:hypothetical protein PFFCH_01523 [Plasmodium falciparum FCH/4]|uniref:Uncharacterized protein n=1 Tax=Plasmodium falciparum FCH/4 TaxID=1036724 RepID=A0A024VS88_PLAFA|nr:hypothetical protein PFFCH_01523 [Plasmodium falciparum FCH/4]